MSISEKKKFQISNICLLNVSTHFALFANSNYSAEGFKWEDFSGLMLAHVESWMEINNIRGDKQEINNHAREVTKEISEWLVKIINVTTQEELIALFEKNQIE